MKFTLHIDPPRTTAQQHRFGGFGRNGRAILYDGAKLRDARDTIAPKTNQDMQKIWDTAEKLFYRKKIEDLEEKVK